MTRGNHSSDRNSIFKHEKFTGAETDLPTFRVFKKEAEKKLRAGGTKYALAYIDFTKFHWMNTKKGVRAGNEALAAYLELLAPFLNPDALLCRYYADVLVLLTPYDDLPALIERVEEVRETGTNWRKECFPDVRMVLKVGLYAAEEGERDLEKMLNMAYIASSQVMEINGYVLLDAENAEWVADDEVKKEAIGEALRSGDLAMYFLPILEIGSKQLVGASAYVGWSGYGKIPAGLTDLFDGTEFIRKPDAQMSDKLFSTIRGWIDKGKHPVPILMEITNENIERPGYFALLEQLIKKYSLPPDLIVMELDEQIFDEEESDVLSEVNSLRKLGVRFVIRDFSHGFASMKMLRNFPVDGMKIDSYVFERKHLSEQERSALRHIVRMAKSLDMNVICSSVENEEQEEMLTGVGCDFVQGKLYGKVLTAGAFEKILPG